MVLQDLKPVFWLMSPLSVSDTLPLNINQFDVVIFDEASQVTLGGSGALPLFRARQVIVVGDPMQLPPTNFFSARQLDDEVLMPKMRRASGRIADSNTSQPRGPQPADDHARLALPQPVESLISFSNAAFYQGRLLSVPGGRRATPKYERAISARPPRKAKAPIAHLWNIQSASISWRTALYAQRPTAP